MPPAPMDAPPDGSVLDGVYRVQRVVGRGGMGLVLPARDALPPRGGPSPPGAGGGAEGAAPAVPRVDINGNEVLLAASGWGTVAWTLLWCALFALLAYAGIRRRPIN